MGSALVHKAYCFGETIRAALGIEIKHYIGVILHKIRSSLQLWEEQWLAYLWSPGKEVLPLSYPIVLLSCSHETCRYCPTYLFFSCF